MQRKKVARLVNVGLAVTPVGPTMENKEWYATRRSCMLHMHMYMAYIVIDWTVHAQAKIIELLF